MKRLFNLTVFVFLVTAMFAKAKVEVYYFHHTRRCVTCQAVETESQKAIANLYANEIKEGMLVFIGVNLDEKDSKALAKLHKVEGQTLLVVGGKKRVDLTEKGFMYARNRPDALKAELKKAIDQLLK